MWRENFALTRSKSVKAGIVCAYFLLLKLVVIPSARAKAGLIKTLWRECIFFSFWQTKSVDARIACGPDFFKFFLKVNCEVGGVWKGCVILGWVEMKFFFNEAIITQHQHVPQQTLIFMRPHLLCYDIKIILGIIQYAVGGYAIVMNSYTTAMVNNEKYSILVHY